MRILVVEDEVCAREALQQELAQRGCTVNVAADGEEGVFLGTEYELDAAIVDLGLRKISGMDVLHRLREIGRKFPILLLTARSSWQEKVHAFAAGADD